MPTPVSTAKQCLNTEACHALDGAVSVARRRGHPQTTSLHAVSSFLSLSPSQLKEACMRARNATFYSPKLRFKALDFCLSMSLDRLPMAQPRVDEPHVSNSLIAAIKRSQAYQRRHPDCIVAVNSMSQFQDQNSGVKVDLQHLIVSILDDPIVSRVFNDAGFSSFDVKLAVLRPFEGLFRYPDQGLCRVRFPIPGSWDAEGEYSRVVEVLRRKKGRNPLLVGACANEVLKGFVEALERRKEDILPMDMHGVKLVSIEDELSKFATAKLSSDAVDCRFKEADLMVDQCIGHRLIVNVGNVAYFLGMEEECETDVISLVVRKLTKLLAIHCGRAWLIGCATNDQCYMEFIRRFPFIDKDWDLHPLPITYIKPSMGDSAFKSSLMGSFVPFGGFFSSPPDPKGPFSSRFQYASSCNVVDGKLQQDVTTLSKRVVAPAADLREDKSVDLLKCRPNVATSFASSTVAGLPRKMDDMSRCQNKNLPSMNLNTFQPRTSVDCHCVEQKVNTLTNESSCTSSFYSKRCDYAKINTGLFRDLQKQQDDIFHVKRSKSSSKTEHLGLDLFSQAKDPTHASFAGQGVNDFKVLFQALFERIGRQSDALKLISQIVSHQKSALRGDIWLNFIGPDIFGKRKTALALAEILYGSKKYFVHMNFCSQYAPIVYSKKLFGYQLMNGSSDARVRGKTIIDHIVEELRRTPFGVIFLENVQSADQVAQRSLLQAIRNGKFSDSYGREISLTNRVFVLTSRLGEDSSTSLMGQRSKFSEARMERVKNWPLQLMVKPAEDCNKNQNSFILGSERIIADQFFMNKRKLSVRVDQAKRQHKGSSISLDLNLPPETTDEGDDSNYGNTESWLEELSDEEVAKTLVKVVFDPYDYMAMASKVLKLVNASFCKSIDSECLLEIEQRAMDQIMTAVSLLTGDKEFKDWIDHVLSKSFAEVQNIYKVSSHSIVTLTTSDGEALCTEEPVGGVCLPSKIVVT